LYIHTSAGFEAPNDTRQRTLGSRQEDAFGIHRHSVLNVFRVRGIIGPSLGNPSNIDNALIAGFPYAESDPEFTPYNVANNAAGFDAAGAPLDQRVAVTSSSGQSETRPINVAVSCIIRAKLA